MDKYLTVAEFAKLVDLTPQAIYPRLEKDLKDYVEVFKGKKCLDSGALSLFNVVIEKSLKPEIEIIEKLEKDIDQEKEKNQALENDLLYFKDLLKNSNETLNILKDQLLEKDKQIEQLNEHLRFSNSLIDQSQRLNAAEKVKQLAEDTEKKKKKWYQFWL